MGTWVGLLSEIGGERERERETEKAIQKGSKTRGEPEEGREEAERGEDGNPGQGCCGHAAGLFLHTHTHTHTHTHHTHTPHTTHHTPHTHTHTLQRDPPRPSPSALGPPTHLQMVGRDHRPRPRTPDVLLHLPQGLKALPAAAPVLIQLLQQHLLCPQEAQLPVIA